MRLRTSHSVLVLLVIATAVVLVPARALHSNDTLLMTVWGMPFEDKLFKDLYAEGYAKLHPEISVRYERYVDVIPKYEAWHAVGRGADVMRLPITNYHAYVAKGMLYPLNAFLNDPQIGLDAAAQADFFPMIWDALALDGERYALPSDNAQYGLYYNRTLFDDYNAAHPDAPLSYPSAAWTWDDLRDASRKLTQRDSQGTVTQFGVSFEIWAWPFLTFFEQAGGQAWDADQTTTYINSPAGVRALNLIVELIPREAPLRGPYMPDTASGPDELFKVGKLAMLFDGSWRCPNIELEAPDLNFAVAPLPHDRQTAVVSGSVLWAISRHSAHPREAWEMIKWLTAREQELLYWQTLRVAPPALLSVVHSEGFRSTTGIVVETSSGPRVEVPPMPRARYPLRAAWLEYAITPDATGHMPGFLLAGPYEADLEDQIAAAMASAIRRKQTPQEALDAAAAHVHDIIDRDRAAKGLPRVVRDD